MRKKRKSKFQQRLEEMQLKYREDPTGEPTATKVSLHDRENPVPWISVLDELPPYYASVDIYDGTVHENWARVSHGGERDGPDDFYVNNEDSTVIHNITHWRKRPDVYYRTYDPMTFPSPDPDDIPQYTQRDINGIILNLQILKDKRERFEPAGFHMTINQAIDVIETHTKEARKTRRITNERIASVVWPPKRNT